MTHRHQHLKILMRAVGHTSGSRHGRTCDRKDAALFTMRTRTATQRVSPECVADQVIFYEAIKNGK